MHHASQPFCCAQQIAKRRAALASAHLEAGQGFWLAKQRWLWRRGRLSREQFLMLQLAGLEMDIDPPLQWKRLAHETAHYLHGSQIQPDQVGEILKWELGSVMTFC